MRHLSTVLAPYQVFNRTRKLFEIPSRKKGGIDPRFQVDALAESSGSVSDNKEVVAELWERLLADYEAL